MELQEESLNRFGTLKGIQYVFSLLFLISYSPPSQQLIRSVAVSPDNRWVVTASDDQSVRIWDTRTASWLCTLQGHTNYVRAVDFSPAGKYLASGSEHGEVRLWNIEMLRCW
jgi:WD40 repeat protein